MPLVLRLFLPLYLAAVLAAGENGRAAPVDYTGIDTALPVSRYVLHLPKAYAGGQDLTISVWRRGDRFGQAWASAAGDPVYALSVTCGNGGFYNYAADAGLAQQGSKLRGVLYRGNGWRYEINASVSGGAITGSFAGTTRGRDGKSAPSYQGGSAASQYVPVMRPPMA